MIIHVKENTTREKLQELASQLQAIVVNENNENLLLTGSSIKQIPDFAIEYVKRFTDTGSDIQLANRKYSDEVRSIKIGSVEVGGKTNNTLMMTGPCSVESEEQIRKCAELCVETGVKVLRAGAFKPRTSPYSFQGLGEKGLQLLAKMRSEYGLLIITEIRDSTHADTVIEVSDIVQIGAKSMYDHGILKACGNAKKPVLLKRGFGTTLQEFVQAAEFMLSRGNSNIMLCERGIRTFETKTRFTLDLCGVAWLKEHTNLPVFVDPSHAMGYAYGVPSLTKAAAALGVDGLIIETHPNPSVALSDASQQLNFNEFRKLMSELPAVTTAVGRHLV